MDVGSFGVFLSYFGEFGFKFLFLLECFENFKILLCKFFDQPSILLSCCLWFCCFLGWGYVKIIRELVKENLKHYGCLFVNTVV